VNLRPLKDRVLIRPEVPSDTTPSGLILAEHRKPEQTGTVVAVGSIEHPRRDEVLEIATALDEIFDQGIHLSLLKPLTGESRSVTTILRELVNHQSAVAVGDYVIFSWNVGQEVWVEDGQERYLLMRESDILAVVEDEEA